MIVHEWAEPLPVETPLGKGLAVSTTFGTNDNKWTVVLETRAIVDFPQRQILAQRDFTNGRGITATMLKAIIDKYTLTAK